MNNNEDQNSNIKIEDDPILVRKNKRQALIDAGVNPYGHAFSPSDTIKELLEKYAKLEDGEITDDEVSVAGRLMAKRGQGKVAFMELKDSSAKCQIFVRINNLGEEKFYAMKDLDVGDWISVSGKMMKTKRGEVSICVDDFELMSKSLRPLPEKFHGLTDKETRYRERYVDLIVNDEVKQTFIKRSKIISSIRQFMDSRGYYEVETPFLHQILGGANAKPFITHFNALDLDLYLRIATELPLKRLLVGGMDKVYELGRQFRNEGMDPHHNPEFTTIEFYEAFSDLKGMMEITQALIQNACLSANGTLEISYQGNEIDIKSDFKVATMSELASIHSGEDVNINRSRDELKSIAEKVGVEVLDNWCKGKILSEIFEAVAEEKLIQPTFVTEHPLEVSPLAMKCPDNELLTQRFELFICGHEYANAFTELNDPVDQAERFHSQVEAKGMGDDEAMGYDADYIRALEYGMPPAGGCGIGIDRLVMLLTDSSSIRDVLLFPTMKPIQ